MELVSSEYEKILDVSHGQHLVLATLFSWLLHSPAKSEGCKAAWED